jgi:hypothetical protein
MSACSKKEEVRVDEKRYLVKFRAVGFTQSIGEFSVENKIAEAANIQAENIKMISNLYFVVFDSQGMVAQIVKQDTIKSANFGSAEFNLSKGNYRLAIVGASFGHTIQTESLDKFSISTGGEHAFCSELFSFEVSDDTELSEELIIKRVSSQLDIIFDNIIPDIAQYVIVEIPAISKYNFFSQNSDNVSISRRFDLRGLSGKEGVKFSTALFSGNEGVNSPKDLRIMLYDKDNAVIITRSIPNIKFEKNKITEIKGNIFEDPTRPFSVKISSDFEGQIDFTF